MEDNVAYTPEKIIGLIQEHAGKKEVVDLIRDQFEIHGQSPDLQDGSGMTLLMHAAWTANLHLTQFLLSQGSDPNGGKDHEHGYSTLHFAALKGSPQVCLALLEAGADPLAVNTLKRTATQMAAFVGMHKCVSVINNFVPRETVYYFTRKQPLETEPKLPLPLAKLIHNLVLNMNIHPVNLALLVKKNPELLDNLPTVTRVLKLMSDREFQNRKDVHEVLALKFYMIHYILKDAEVQMKNCSAPLGKWIKFMLLGREPDGFPAHQETFLRKGVACFPFQDSQLYKVLMTNFYHNQVYGKGASAAECINQGLNGQKGFKDHETCATCGDGEAKIKCSRCLCMYYCNPECQKLHWFTHKKFCPKDETKKPAEEK